MKFRDWRYYLINSKDLEFKIYLDFPQFEPSNGHITLYLLCYIILYFYLLIFLAVKPWIRMIPIFIVLKILESLWN